MKAVERARGRAELELRLLVATISENLVVLSECPLCLSRELGRKKAPGAKYMKLVGSLFRR